MKTRSGKTYTKDPIHNTIPNPTLDYPHTESDYVDNSNIGLYEVSIDFDDASLEWQRNKRKLHNGTYEYRCMFVSSSGRECTGRSMPNSTCCYCHRKFANKL